MSKERKIEESDNVYKEFIIVISILVLVFTVDFFTNNYVRDTVKVMQDNLENLKNIIIQNELDDVESRMAYIKKLWDKKYEILAYYIEHDELEKVETGLAVLGANLQLKEYNGAIEDLEETIYILKHIQEKEQISLKSIF